MKMSMEHWWNDTDRAKPKYWEKNCSQCFCDASELFKMQLVPHRKSDSFPLYISIKKNCVEI
jgi:hypothetical protein